MLELNEGEEICPICSAINNPGAAEFGCDHFVAIIWEGELHWTHPMIDELITEIELIQEIIIDNEHLFNIVDDQLFNALDPNCHKSHDALFNILTDNQIKFGNSEGGGSTCYVESKNNLSDTLVVLNAFKQKLKG